MTWHYKDTLLPEICYGRQANVITAGGLAHTMGFNCVAAEQLLKWSRVSVFLLFGHYTASGWSRTSRQPLVPRKDTVPLVHPEPSLCHLPVKGSWFLDLKPGLYKIFDWRGIDSYALRTWSERKVQSEGCSTPHREVTYVFWVFFHCKDWKLALRCCQHVQHVENKSFDPKNLQHIKIVFVSMGK